MAKPFRRLFFWSLVAIFLLSAPLVVFYALGYRYHADRGIFVYTGSITVKSNPTTNIGIRLNGEDVSAEVSSLNRSFTVGGLRPGKYRMDVSAPGFSSWSKEAIVSSGVSTEFWNVVLTRDSYAGKQFSLPKGSSRIFPSPKADRVAALLSQNGEVVLDVLDRNAGTVTQVFSSVDTVLFDEEHLAQSVFWSNRDNNILLVRLSDKENGAPMAFLIRLDTGETTNLRDVIGSDRIDDVRWSPNKNAIVVLSGTTLSEVDVLAPWTKRHLSDNVESFDFFDANIAVLDFGTSVISFFPESRPESRTQITTISPDGFSGTTMQSPGRYSLIAYDQTRIVLLNQSTGECFLWNSGENTETFSRLSSEARGVQFSDDGKKVLYWTDWEIFTFFTRKWEVQPARSEGDRIDVGRFSEPIRNVQWSKDYEHVVFSSGKDVLLTELDGRGGRNLLPIIHLPEMPEQVAIYSTDNLLFALYPAAPSSKDTTGVTLSEITFPEPSGLFGIGG